MLLMLAHHKDKEKVDSFLEKFISLLLLPINISSGTLYDKVWDAHVVDKLPCGQYQIFVDIHLMHETTCVI